MTDSKIYFKEYYQKNREKILFRVKTNYYKHKFIKFQPNKSDTNEIKEDNQRKPIIDRNSVEFLNLLRVSFD